MQEKILENIVEQLEEKQREYEAKAEQIRNMIESFKAESDFKRELYKVEILSPLSFSDGKNIVLIRRGHIEDILKDAEKEFKRLNGEVKTDKVYKVKILIAHGKKIIKISISEEIISTLIKDIK
jgi:hypothetical protein